MRVKSASWGSDAVDRFQPPVHWFHTPHPMHTIWSDSQHRRSLSKTVTAFLSLSLSDSWRIAKKYRVQENEWMRVQ